MKSVIGVPTFKLPNHVGFGGNQNVTGIWEFCNKPNNRLCTSDKVALASDIGWALRVSHCNATGQRCLLTDQIAYAENLMHHAGAVPKNHFSASNLLKVLAQVPIRNKQDFHVRWNPADNLLGIARGNHPVAQSLGSGRTVDVSHGLEFPAILAEHFLISGQFGGRAAVSKAAPCLQVRQQHALGGIKNLGGLCHEMNTAEHNRAIGYLCRRARQLQAVACEVGNRLNLTFLVVVRQNRRIFSNLQGLDFSDNIRDYGRHGLAPLGTKNSVSSIRIALVLSGVLHAADGVVQE